MTAKPEVRQEDRDMAAWALDRSPNSQTWETLTAAHRTPDQIWQANRAAQAFARHREAADARTQELVAALENLLAEVDAVAKRSGWVDTGERERARSALAAIRSSKP